MSAMDATTLRDMAAPLAALRVLLSDFAALPAGWVRVSDHYPDRLELSFHDNLGAFETWRDALGIAPESVTCGEQGDGRTRVLKAEVDYAGARVALTGYSAIYHTAGGAA
jgi:hypothetical protein